MFFSMTYINIYVFKFQSPLDMTFFRNSILHKQYQQYPIENGTFLFDVFFWYPNIKHIAELRLKHAKEKTRCKKDQVGENLCVKFDNDTFQMNSNSKMSIRQRIK